MKQVKHTQEPLSRGSAGFDDEEAEPWDQSEEEDCVNTSSLDWTSEHGEDHGTHANIPHKKKRLYGKTHPSLAPAYPKRALLKLSEYRLRRYKFKEAKRVHDRKLKKLRCQAVGLMAMQPPTGAFADEEWNEPGAIVNPHPSHRIAALHGRDETIYCKSCGCWASKVSLKLLAEPCQGLKASSRHTLRLLECGVKPGLEARIPSHLKLRHARKGRRRCKGRW